MVLNLSVYFAVFAISAGMMFLYQRISNGIHVRGIVREKGISTCVLYLVSGCLFLFPIIAMYGLRYGIGTDYFSYEEIFNTLHATGFAEYWEKYNQGINIYYVEPGYYLLNRLFPSYRTLLWGIGILIFSLFFLGIKPYAKNLSFSFSLYVFLATQFIYSMNGSRFIVALCFVLLGYNALIQNRSIKFVLFVIAAALFHRSVLFCFAMLFLKKYKHKGINNTRNIALFAAIMFFPFVGGIILRIAGNIPFFSRYFETSQYTASETMGGGFAWLLHVVPVYLPLLILARKEIFNSEDTKVLFRICIMEIPFRMLGLYNTWYTRFSRCAQIAQFIFIPLILQKIENKRNRVIMYAYYVLWFIFYFAYYAIVNDGGDSLPYVWVFSK